jgi:glycosyltransferase involved in cell wall biosynthesis
LNAPSDTPRILHCLWSGAPGGLERAVYQLVREQLRQGSVAPTVLFPGASGPYVDHLEEIGCPVIVLGLPHGHTPRLVTRSREVMKGFDLHHFHTAEPLIMLASLRCRGVTRIYTHRGGVKHYSPRKQVRYRLVGALARNSVHGLSANTAHGARCAAQLLKIDLDQFLVTYNGIEFSLLEPNRSPQDARRELRLSEDDFVLGTSAILKSGKRIGRLIEAISALPDPDVRLVVLGDGPARGGLEKLASRLGGHDRVIFTGLVTDVADYLQIMDVFCLPSVESFGNAAVEAMALEIPTIGYSDGGGLLEHIEDGKTGFLVDDLDELCHVVKRLHDDPGLRAEIGYAGSKSVRGRYTLEKAAAGYNELYESALRSAGRAVSLRERPSTSGAERSPAPGR